MSLRIRRRFLAAAAALPAVGHAAVMLGSTRKAPGTTRTVVIRFSHVVAPGTPKGKAAERFRQLVQERLGDRVRVDVYHNSRLYKDREELEALQLGAVEMLAPSLSKFGPVGVPEFELFDLPFIFDSYAQMRAVTQNSAQNSIGRVLLGLLESKGLLGLAYWDNGFKQMSANRPLRTLQDFAGLRMRVQSSRVLEAQMRALGAVPVITAFSDAQRALRSGAADGTENPLSNFYTQRMHEVQSHLTLTDHGYLGYAVVVNRRFWERLPRDVREVLEAALAEATRYGNDIAQADNEQALQAVRASGRTQVITLDAEQKRVLKRALLPVHRQMENTIGGDLIRRIYRETGVDPKSF